jgi:hypothetical protein
MDETIGKSVLAEIKKLAGEVSSLRIGQDELRAEMKAGFAAVDKRFDRVEKEIRVIRDQTGNLVERVTLLERSKEPRA